MSDFKVNEFDHEKYHENLFSQLDDTMEMLSWTVPGKHCDNQKIIEIDIEFLNEVIQRGLFKHLTLTEHPVRNGFFLFIFKHQSFYGSINTNDIDSLSVEFENDKTILILSPLNKFKQDNIAFLINGKLRLHLTD